MTIYKNLTYLDKNRYGEPFDLPEPDPNLGLCIVIPISEMALIERTLHSLNQRSSGNQSIEILISGVGEGDHDSRRLEEWRKENNFLYPIYTCFKSDIPDKHLTSGLIRKLAMDEALDRLKRVETKPGLILSLDAGVEVPENFYPRLGACFFKKPKVSGLGFNYRREEESQKELYERFFVKALKWAGYPNAYLTIGNNFVCTAHIYEKVSGMNRKNHDEGFYFQQKIIAQSRFRTCRHLVLKNPRPDLYLAVSERKGFIPSLPVFEELKNFFAAIEDIFKGVQPETGPAMASFMVKEQAWEKIEEMREYSNSLETFQKRFWAWMNPLLIRNFVKWASEHYYAYEHDVQVCNDLLELLGKDKAEGLSPILEIFRGFN